VSIAVPWVATRLQGSPSRPASATLGAEGRKRSGKRGGTRGEAVNAGLAV
jgi:hypothetical protein